MSSIAANPVSVVALFERLATKCGAKKFVYGGARKLQEVLQNVDAEEYPIFHLDRPNIVTESNGSNHVEWYRLDVNVFVKFSSMGEVAENNASELEAERVSMQVLHALQKELHHGSRYDDFDFDLDRCTKDPVLDNFVPNHLGWQMSFKVGFNSNVTLC